ncbi:hypothetical protein [Pseudorhodobacter ferrugineus]|uniref:hypothetical protein n=1 Tax=Pseudorhodobacter ferrugineus TaxID=77008 RepID=UPI0004195098|nr:hypothetical protein [Pseudorhodobacter ferrugineus]
MRLTDLNAITGGLAALCLGAGAALSDPATLTAADPQAIAVAMLKLGYRAELTKDNTGDPMIRSGASG